MPNAADRAPKNRLKKPLELLRIEIVHAAGTEVTDPNGAAMMVFSSSDKILGFGPVADRESDISGEPAVVYRADDIELSLTPAECLRLLAHSLRPEEYHALVRSYGMAFEWHEDFYDSETGVAVQPRIVPGTNPSP